MTAEHRIRVAVIFGGRSAEHEISLLSAEAIIAALNPARYDVVRIGVTRDGRWLSGGDPLATLRALSEGQSPPADYAPGPLPIGLLEQADIAFPVLHGPYGEDGTIQGLFEMLNLPYVGAGVLGSALGMDKAAQKTVLRQHGIPVTDNLVFLRSRWQDNRGPILDAIERDIGYPCFVKPSALGSSIGITKVKSADAIIAAIETAAVYDRRILVERAVDAREIECSILGNDEPLASPLGEIVPGNEFYDYDAKYHSPETRLIITADLPAAIADEMRRLALATFLALDAAGMARVDMFLERGSNRIYISELNTIPGFTQVSMYPKLWDAAGVGFGELVDRLITLGFERFRERQQCSVRERSPR